MSFLLWWAFIGITSFVVMVIFDYKDGHDIDLGYLVKGPVTSILLGPIFALFFIDTLLDKYGSTTILKRRKK